jgi:hypothetical protein
VEASDVRIEDGHFIIPKIKLNVEDSATGALRRQIFGRIGQTQLTDILVETDRVTRFSHAALGRAPRGDAELITFYAALLALGSDLSAADMARMVPGLTAYTIGAMIRRLEHRTDHGKSGLRAANDAVLGHFRRLPVAKVWGEGVTASSDMMSIETSRKLWAARLDPRRKTASIGTYTHVLALNRKNALFAGSDEGASYCPSNHLLIKAQIFVVIVQERLASLGERLLRAPHFRGQCRLAG